jgi:DNA-binding LacI/PurR family transcriptional regulator
MKAKTISVRLRDEFTRQIRSGRWPVERQIPSELDLAQRYGASRTAVRSALSRLEEKGWLHSRQGSGRMVLPQAAQWSASIGLFTRGTEMAVGQGSRYFAAVDAEIARLGHSLISFAYNRLQGLDASRRRLRWDLLDGAILYANQYDADFAKPLARRIPLVSMPHDATVWGLPSFFVDYGFHAAVAVQELAARGHRHIGLLLSRRPERAALNSTIRRGYDLGRLNSGLPLDPGLVIHYAPHDDPESPGNLSLYDQCRRLDPGITAVLAAGAGPLMSLVHIGQEKDPRWSRALSMVCLADLSNDLQLPLPIAHFALDVERVARDAVRHLHQMLQGQSEECLAHPYYGVFVPQGTARRQED